MNSLSLAKIKFSFLCEQANLLGDSSFVSAGNAAFMTTISGAHESVARRWSLELDVWAREMFPSSVSHCLIETFAELKKWKGISLEDSEVLLEILKKGTILSESEYRVAVLASSGEVNIPNGQAENLERMVIAWETAGRFGAEPHSPF